MFEHFRFPYWALWVLVLGAFSCDDQPPPQLAKTSTAEEAALFRLVPPEESGVHFENALPENDQLNILAYEYFYNGGGVAIGDLNGDSLPDLVFTANLVANRLYFNTGNFTFKEASVESGFVSRDGWKTGVTLADVNADGWLDIYVCRSGKLGESERRNELFLNLGQGRFREAAAEFGLDDPGYSTHATFFDYDRDGDLDCFVLNHALKPSFNLSVSQVKTQRDPFFGDHLYRNDNGKFVDVSAGAGIIGNPIGFGLSVTVEDFDRDGWPDLFVANDYTEEDYFYHNQRNGSFREILDPAFAHTSHFSMGSDAGDINGDGWPDLMVLDMLPEDNLGQKILKGPDNYDRYQTQVRFGFHHQLMRNTLQLNLGRGLNQGVAFSESGQLTGVSNTDWSWSPLLADFDNDGDLDLHVTNGYVRASTHLDFVKYDYPAAIQVAQQAGKPLSEGEISKRIPSIRKPNVIFRNNGPDKPMQRMTTAWGLDRPSFSNGAAFGDLDGDGDLDLVVNNLKEKAFIYENTTSGSSITLSLQGPSGNPFAFGTVVNAVVNGQPQRRMLMSARGFQSSVEPIIHLGLGQAAQADRIEIIWPNGQVQQLGPLAAGRHRITWKPGLPAYLPPKLRPEILNSGGFLHQDDDLVEFKAQPLLPYQLGNMGPCLAARETGPGTGEVFVGGGPGQHSQRFTYRVQSGRVQWSSQALPDHPEAEITDIALFDADGDGDEDLILVAGGNDPSRPREAYQCQLLLRDGEQFRQGNLPAVSMSAGCVAAGDADGDGDLDLFIGARVKVGEYPLSPTSVLLLNDGRGNFQPGTLPAQGMLGMITDARWADLNGDQRQELVLSGEWTGIRVMAWENGALVEKSEAYGLAGSTGLWTRVEIADLDGDGDPDLLTGNVGLNSQLQASGNQPLRLYAGDFDQNGTIDPVMSYYLAGQEVPVASRDELLGQLRYLQKQFPRYEQYARATMDQVLSPTQRSTGVLQAGNLASGWWKQEGGKFTFQPWPLMAQASPVFGQEVADWNGDGYLDVLLAGNFYPVRPETGRFDASAGVLLLGDGKGGFRATMAGQANGCWLTGDIRDLVSLDLDETGRLLVAGRNQDSWLWGIWPLAAR